MNTTPPPLTEHDFVTLDKLSRKAADDSMRAHGGHVTEDDRFDSLAMHLLEIGVRAWRRFDPVAYPDVQIETYAYRAMRGHRAGAITDGPYFDWIRRTVRDSRFEPDITTSLTTDGDMPETSVVEAESVAAYAATIARTLDPYNARTLLDLVVPMVEDHLGHEAAAAEAGFTIGEALDRLDSLARQLHDLRPVTRVTPDTRPSIFLTALGITPTPDLEEAA